MINNIINFLIEPRPEKPLYLIRNLISIRAIRPGIREHGYDPDLYEVIMNRAAMPGRAPQTRAVFAEAPYPNARLLSAYQKLISRSSPESRDDLAIDHRPQDVILLEMLGHSRDISRDINHLGPPPALQIPLGYEQIIDRPLKCTPCLYS